MRAEETLSPELRTRTREIIEELTDERQEMLVLFCRAAGLEPYSTDTRVTEVMEEFCQVLVDYIALGHFELFKRIADGTEQRQEARRVADEIYPKFLEATQIAVDFNDKYDCSKRTRAAGIADLSKDLSRLGEALATRLELEDRVIAAMSVQ